MALKVLLLRKKLTDQQAALRALEKAAEGFAVREAELAADIEAAQTDEERSVVEDAVSAFETERDNNAAEQVLLLEREVAGGAPAVVLLPADRELLSGAVSAAAAGKTTLVTVETDMTAWGAAASVSMDHHALGEALGTAAMHGVPAGGTVLLLDSLPGDNGIRERLEAAREALEREGRQVREYQWSGDETLFADILRIERPGAVIAFEAAALAEVAELSRGENFPLLYGCGSTTGIAAALEKGRVTAIAAVNVFSAGYLAVEAAASLARHEDWTGAPTVAFSVVRQETMYESDNQKLLFPVT